MMVSKTSETDEAHAEISGKYGSTAALSYMTDHARQLEIQRDDARAELAKLKEVMELAEEIIQIM